MLLFYILILGGCKKEEVLVRGNQAPDDPTISTLLKENYIHKVYLNLFGRQPVETELNASLVILNKNNCSTANRTELLNQLFDNSEYRLQLYNIEIADLLNGITQAEIDEEVVYFQDKLNDPANASDSVIISMELHNTLLLQSLKNSMLNGTADLISAQRIISNSPAFEDINGGGEEWIKAIFKHYLFREPTETELENCLEMTDNRAATLFFTEGNSRNNLVQIFFSSQSYFEGQIRTLYQRYLFREPHADECAALTYAYKQFRDYKDIQKKIMLTNEFLGVN